MRPPIKYLHGFPLLYYLKHFSIFYSNWEAQVTFGSSVQLSFDQESLGRVIYLSNPGCFSIIEDIV